MSARVLFNLLNELGKSYKCEACQAFYHLCRNKLDKFHNTGARRSALAQRQSA